MSWPSKLHHKEITEIKEEMKEPSKEREKVRGHFTTTPVFSLTTHQTYFMSRFLFQGRIQEPTQKSSNSG